MSAIPIPTIKDLRDNPVKVEELTTDYRKGIAKVVSIAMNISQPTLEAPFYAVTNQLLTFLNSMTVKDDNFTFLYTAPQHGLTLEIQTDKYYNDLSKIVEPGSNSSTQLESWSFLEEDDQASPQAASTPPRVPHVPEAKSSNSPDSQHSSFEIHSPYSSTDLVRQLFPESPLSSIRITRGQVRSRKLYPDFLQFQNLYTTLPNKDQKEWVADPLVVWENKPEAIKPGQLLKLQVQVIDQATFTFATYTVCNSIPVISLVGIQWGASLFERRDGEAQEISAKAVYKPLFFYDDGIYDLCPEFKNFYRRWVQTLGWDCPEFG